MTAIINIEQLQPVLCDLCVAPAVAMKAMKGGSSPVYRIDLSDGESLVLKVYPDHLGTMPAKEARAAARLHAVGVPVTQYLLLEENRERLPFRFAITSYLRGVAARDLKNDPGISDVYRQTGTLLRKLHTVEMSGYGRLGGDGVSNPIGTNAEYMRFIIRSTFEKFRHFGGNTALADRLHEIAENQFDAIVSYSAGPVFAHDDLHPGNVLVTRSEDGKLRLSGLIDFGNAHAADAVLDLAKSLFCATHEDSKSRVPILEGYGEIDHPDPDAALWYYTLLHRMIMWWWLRHVGAIQTPDTPSGLIDDLREMAETASA